MTRILVIADDLTGAAEIAGIGLRYGLPTRLVRDHPGRCEHGLTVMDTDSRPMPPAGITVGGGASPEDLRLWAARVTNDVLAAGGADFFQSILEFRGAGPARPAPARLSGEATLFVCGSASAYSIELAARAAREG